MQKEAAPRAVAAHHRSTAVAAPDRAKQWARQAEQHAQQEDWASAVRCYQQAIACCPAAAQLRFCLGAMLDRLGQPEAAIRQYQQAIALQPGHLAAYSNWGCALVKQNRPAEAVEVYQRAIALKPNWATLHNNLGQAYLAQGKTAAAIAAYQRAVAHQPDWALAHRNLGIAWRQQQEHREAVACFQRAVDLNPNDPTALAECGSARLALGEWQQAMRCFQRAIAPQAAWISAYCDWAEKLTDADTLSLAQHHCGRFLRRLQQQPHHDETRQALIQTCLHWGDALIQSDQPQQAEAHYQQALRLQPQPELLHRLGRCLAQQGRSNAAILVYHLALAARPHAPTHLELGRVLEQQQRFDRAIECYQQAWQAPPAPKLPLGDGSPRPAQARSECAGLSCAPCLQQIRSRFRFIHRKGSVRIVGQGAIDFPVLPAFVETIPQGRAWAIPQRSWWQECRAVAVLTAEGELRADLSRQYPGQLPPCQQPPASHPAQTAKLPPPEPIAGSIAVLTGLSGHVYFHWMVDILPRIALLRREMGFGAIDQFWVNSMQQPFQRETLAALGVPLEKVLESDRHPHIQAAQLVAPSFAGHLGWLEPWALDFLRQTFLPPRRAGYPDRLYISRRRARHRRVLNEAAVIDCLHPLGFVAIELESLSVAAQAALFAHARIVVAPHGSGLTNLVFCSPQATVIELVSPHYVGHYYWAIAHQLALRHYYVPGDALCDPIRSLMYPNPLTEDLWVNLRSLTRLLQDVLEGRGESTDDAELSN